MNQDSSFPPMLPPSTELGALLFAVLPCLQETYRPLAAFAYHMTELTRLKSIPSMPPLTGLSGIDALITDKDVMLRSLSFYGRMFHMPLLSTIATLLQGMQFYRTYKDILPGLFSGMGGSDGDSSSAFGSMAGLFSGLGGFGGSSGPENSSSDLFSMLGGLSPDLLSSLFSGFSGSSTPHGNKTSSASTGATEYTEEPPLPSDPSASADISGNSAQLPDTILDETDSSESPDPKFQQKDTSQDDTIYNTLYSFLTPEQQKIYEQLMHTD